MASEFLDDAPIRVGDVVRLRSGGPDMTVVGLGEKPHVTCAWWRSYGLPGELSWDYKSSIETIHVAALVLISRSPPAKAASALPPRIEEVSVDGYTIVGYETPKGFVALAAVESDPVTAFASSWRDRPPAWQAPTKEG